MSRNVSTGIALLLWALIVTDFQFTAHNVLTLSASIVTALAAIRWGNELMYRWRTRNSHPNWNNDESQPKWDDES